MNLRTAAMTTGVLFALTIAPSASAQTVTTPDLKTIAGGEGWTARDEGEQTCVGEKR